MTTHRLLSQGRMSASAIRFSASLLLVAGGVACGGETTTPVSTGLTTPVPSAARSLSGNNQTVHAGVWLELPLVVVVSDRSDRVLPNVRVDWRIVSGEGELASSPGVPLAEPFTTTDAFGRATVFARFTTQGRGTVAASVPNAPIPPVTFTANMTDQRDLSIDFGPMFDCMPSDPSAFYVRKQEADTVSVQLGGAVSWRYSDWLHGSCRARLVSDEVPPGGERFDSGNLFPGETFRFVPNVPGTWKYREAVNGGHGTLVVRAAP